MDARYASSCFAGGHSDIAVETLSVFGPNISTVSGAPLYRNVAHREKAEGQDWQRQRKLTATPFNEQKSVQIWSEAIRQSSDMLQAWLSRSSDTSSGLTSTSEDTRTLALHVLAFVGFQRSYPFQSKSKSTFVDAKSMTYRDSLALILKNAIVVMVLPQAAFSIPFLPNSWKQIGWAIQSFREYMMGQLVEERRLVREGRPGTGTLVSNLVRAGEGAGDSKTGSLKPLSESEILGNIFVFNFAGHDTTAISMAYAMLLLVAHPEVQDWISEEVRFYLKNPDPQSWVYSEAFPRLKRCLAVLVSRRVTHVFQSSQPKRKPVIDSLPARNPAPVQPFTRHSQVHWRAAPVPDRERPHLRPACGHAHRTEPAGLAHAPSHMGQ